MDAPEMIDAEKVTTFTIPKPTIEPWYSNVTAEAFRMNARYRRNVIVPVVQDGKYDHLHIVTLTDNERIGREELAYGILEIIRGGDHLAFRAAVGRFPVDFLSWIQGGME